jgi:hypothetical protein
MKIFENVLPKEDLKYLQDVLLHENFMWYFYPVTTTCVKYIDKKTFEAPQFVHVLVRDEKITSEYYLQKLSNILDKIYKNIDINKITRMKFNLQLSHKKKKGKLYNRPHTDDVAIPTNKKILLFYINDSDSYTYFFKNKKVFKKIKNKANTLIQFDGNIIHAGSNPEKKDKKLCLNVNYS